MSNWARFDLFIPSLQSVLSYPYITWWARFDSQCRILSLSTFHRFCFYQHLDLINNHSFEYYLTWLARFDLILHSLLRVLSLYGLCARFTVEKAVFGDRGTLKAVKMFVFFSWYLATYFVSMEFPYIYMYLFLSINCDRR